MGNVKEGVSIAHFNLIVEICLARPGFARHWNFTRDPRALLITWPLPFL